MPPLGRLPSGGVWRRCPHSRKPPESYRKCFPLWQRSCCRQRQSPTPGLLNSASRLQSLSGFWYWVRKTRWPGSCHRTDGCISPCCARFPLPDPAGRRSLPQKNPADRSDVSLVVLPVTILSLTFLMQVVSNPTDFLQLTDHFVIIYTKSRQLFSDKLFFLEKSRLTLFPQQSYRQA